MLGPAPLLCTPFLSCSAPEPSGTADGRFLSEEEEPVVHTGQTLLPPERDVCRKEGHLPPSQEQAKGSWRDDCPHATLAPSLHKTKQPGSVHAESYLKIPSPWPVTTPPSISYWGSPPLLGQYRQRSNRPSFHPSERHTPPRTSSDQTAPQPPAQPVRAAGSRRPHVFFKAT